MRHRTAPISNLIQKRLPGATICLNAGVGGNITNGNGQTLFTIIFWETIYLM